jgi:hypothetical protein
MSEQQEQDNEFEKQFAEERSNYTNLIRSLSIRMNNIREIAEVQVDLFSERQRLLERAHSLGSVLGKLNKKLRKDRGDRMRHYSEMTQVRYGSNEKTPLIESDLTEIKSRIEMVDNQMGFINETIKTVDHMLYGVKFRISLEEYRSGTVK